MFPVIEDSASFRLRTGGTSGTSDPCETELNALVLRMQRGDTEAFAEAFEALYGFLKNASRQHIPAHSEQTLSGTALVHEVYVKLEGYAPERVTDSRHFQRLACRTMRTVLIDYHRAKRRDKRSARGERVALEEIAQELMERARDPELLDEALTRLEEWDPQAAQVVELHFFGGMTYAQIADNLGLTVKRVETEWKAARAWLQKELRERDG